MRDGIAINVKKLHIDQRGFLYCVNKEREIPQLCPFRSSLDHCGNWCPHFHTVDETQVELTCSGMEVALIPTEELVDESE